MKRILVLGVLLLLPVLIHGQKRTVHTRPVLKFTRIENLKYQDELSGRDGESHWESVAKGDDGYEFYVNVGSWERKGDFVTFWIKIWAPGAKLDSQEFDRYNCKEKTLTPLTIITYNPNGSVNTSRSMANDPPEHIAPDTVAASIFKAVCVPVEQ